jgi:hypothetical protein
VLYGRRIFKNHEYRKEELRGRLFGSRTTIRRRSSGYSTITDENTLYNQKELANRAYRHFSTLPNHFLGYPIDWLRIIF